MSECSSYSVEKLREEVWLSWGGKSWSEDVLTNCCCRIQATINLSLTFLSTLYQRVELITEMVGVEAALKLFWWLLLLLDGLLQSWNYSSEAYSLCIVHYTLLYSEVRGGGVGKSSRSNTDAHHDLTDWKSFYWTAWGVITVATFLEYLIEQHWHFNVKSIFHLEHSWKICISTSSWRVFGDLK